MVARLKSISRQIRWSLALKAAVFALSWWFFPFWLFLLIALYLYFVPWFQAGKLVVPFFALLLLAYLQATGGIFALIFAIIFYAILLIKDLLVIDRRSAYELLVLVLSFLLLRDFYMRFNEGVGGMALLSAFFVAAALALLFQSFLNTLRDDEMTANHSHENLRRVVVWLSFIFLMETIVAGLFLPLDFVYQSIVVFLVVILIIDLISDHLFRTITRSKILTTASVILALFVIILGSARWGL